MRGTATNGALAVELRALVVRFGDVNAVDGLDLEVPHGAFFGLLGPNGAGKTTTVNVLSTLLSPTAGSARLLGRDVASERSEVRRNIGLVFQESTLDPELTAREHLDLYARLYHLKDRRTRVAEMLDLVALSDDADRVVRGFSGGMKRRLEIARGLLHRPRVLFLDEPTLGLDVGARAGIWEHLSALHAAGDTTIFLTTHYMEEADALCGQVAILDRGRLVANGTPEALKAELGGDVVRIAVEQGDGVRERLEAHPGVRTVQLEEPGVPGATTYRVAVAEGSKRLAGLIEAARPGQVVEVTLQRPTLEHVFLHHTGRTLEGEA
jgi:ABC-2 type transport system ATP-binding protein